MFFIDTLYSNHRKMESKRFQLEYDIDGLVYKVNDFNELKPGFDKGLDTICNGIINGDEFVYEN